MAIFKRPALKESRKKREMPQGLWQKCPGCSEVVHEIELAGNQRVCPHCDHHFSQSAKDRIEHLLDPDTFVERDANLRSEDTLQFQGVATYKDRLKKYQDPTGLTDVILAEPKSMIGFAGPRVIKETTHQDLPERFQTAEFLEEHGLIDRIVHRKKLRSEIAEFLGYFAPTQ